MVEKERIKQLNSSSVKDKDYVLYWMQSAQRAEYNPALEFSVEKANERGKRLIVLFVLVDNFPDANARHYYFMLEGLRDVQERLRAKGIKMCVRRGEPKKCVVKASQNADVIITDEGYLDVQCKWRLDVSEDAHCRLYEVVSNLIVPVEEVSDKQEYSARTFRSRINRKLDKYLKPSRLSKIKKSSLNMKFDGLDLDNIEKIIDDLKISKNVNRTNFFNGGTKQAKSRLRSFLKDKIKDYADKSNDPAENCVSDLSPYLHFGQISPLYIALQSQKKKGEGVEAFCEQLIVRRELSHNFVYYNDNYDNYKGLPSWSRRTLNYHTSDKRKYTYTFKQFENAETHDEYWNAAQKQMMITAKMHGYMRMYWGKKILEWTEKPADAVDIALKLNNKYELDGRDPNGYTGVLWCFGLHDHPWAEREIFGKVRYMNAKGLKRKFNIDDYIEKIRKIG